MAQTFEIIMVRYYNNKMMKIYFMVMSLMTMSTLAFAGNYSFSEGEPDAVNIAKAIVSQDEPVASNNEDVVATNNWGVSLCESNFNLAVDLQTKYIWRGMEMFGWNADGTAKDASPVLFPAVGYSWKGFYAYAMGGYAINGSYAEVDLGVSYTLGSLTIGVNDYYYPTTNGLEDNYFAGSKNTGHWFEACLTFAPEKAPLWLTVSNFFAGADKYKSESGESKKAYSTYVELGTYWDFLKANRLSITAGAACDKSCYNSYEKDFTICNIEAKYTYTIHFKNGWEWPLSGAYIYNPYFDKAHFNFTAHFGF